MGVILRNKLATHNESIQIVMLLCSKFCELCFC